MSPSEKPTKEFILLMAAMMSVVAISIDAMLPALGLIGQSIEIAHANQPQYIISLIFAGMALGQLVAGPLSDALGRKQIVYGGLTLYLAGSAVCLWAQTIEMLLLGRFIQGLGVAGPYIACVSIVRDRFSGRSMARVMSLVMMIFIMVPTIAPALGQGMLYLGSWRLIFVMYVAYALLIFLWVSLRLEETLPAEKRIPFQMKNLISGTLTVFRNRRTVFYTLAMSCVFGALIGYLNSCQQIYQEQYGAGDMFVIYFAVQALALGVASLLNSRLVERLGMRYICLRATSLIMVISVILFGLHFVMEISLGIFLTYSIILLFNFGLLFGNLNALALEPMEKIAGLAAAIIGSSSSVLSIILGTVIGQFYNGTLMPMAIGFCLLGAGAFVMLVIADKGECLKERELQP